MQRAWVVSLLLAGCAAPGPAGVIETAVVEQGTTVCNAGDTVRGIDVSSYETSIDWRMAKTSGVEFAIIRVSDGLQYKDPKFPTYWAGAREAGVMRGVYQFFRPTQDPIAQANLVLAAIADRAPGDLPPAIDVETTGGLPPAEVEAKVRAWIDHVTAAIGRPPIIYAGYYSWQDYTGNANLTSSPLWHAQYTSAPCPNIPTPWTRWQFWQHSSTGTVPGVLGEPTDMNVFAGTRAELDAFAAAAPPACMTIPPEGAELDDTSPCFAAGGPAATLRIVEGQGVGDRLVWTRTTGSPRPGNFAQWTLSFAEAGTYRVEVSTPAAFAQSTAARYEVRAAGAMHSLVLDQSAADGWQTLGELAFARGGDQHIELDDNTGEADGAQLVFDAIRITRLDGPPPPAPPEDADDGGCSASRGTAGVWVALALMLVRRRRRQRV
jgi:lysozyme